MDMTDEQTRFYNDCLSELRSRNGDAVFYLPTLRRYVLTVFKAEETLTEIMDDDAVTIKHTNKTGHTNDASSPKVRMFALFNEQAMKLAKELGLSMSNARPAKVVKKKKGFDAPGKMKIA